MPSNAPLSSPPLKARHTSIRIRHLMVMAEVETANGETVNFTCEVAESAEGSFRSRGIAPSWGDAYADPGGAIKEEAERVYCHLAGLPADAEPSSRHLH